MGVIRWLSSNQPAKKRANLPIITARIGLAEIQAAAGVEPDLGALLSLLGFP
jgi:hypothetical protein